MNRKLKSIYILGVLIMGSIPVSALGFDEFVRTIASLITGFFEYLADIILDNLVWFLTWNPDVTIVKPLVSDFIELLTPLYIIAFLSIGIYFFFLSESPKGRARARSALLKLLLSLAFVISATTIYQFLLDLSELLVNFVLSLADINFKAALAIVVPAIAVMPTFLITYNLVLVFLFIIYGLRYLLLLIMAAIFPLIIFFFFFDLTKNYGRKLMRYTLMLIFVPVVQAIIMVFWISTMNSIGSGSGPTGIFAIYAISLSGFVLMIIAPWLMLGLLKWLGGVIMFVGFKFMATGNVSAAMFLSLVGGFMMGEGAGALPMALTIGFIGRLEHAGEHIGEHIVEERRRGYRFRFEEGRISTEEAPLEEGRVVRRGRRVGRDYVGGEPSERFEELAPIDERVMSTNELIVAGDRYMEMGNIERSRGNNKKAMKNFNEAVRGYEKAMKSSITAEKARRPSLKEILADPKKAEVYAKMGDAYRELNLMDPQERYSKNALNYYRTSKELYETAMKSPDLASGKKSEYALKAIECDKKAADILYKRG